jgi:hypothetical protein
MRAWARGGRFVLEEVADEVAGAVAGLGYAEKRSCARQRGANRHRGRKRSRYGLLGPAAMLSELLIEPLADLV